VGHVEAWKGNYFYFTYNQETWDRDPHPKAAGEMPGRDLGAKTPEAKDKNAYELHIYMYISMKETNAGVFCGI